MKIKIKPRHKWVAAAVGFVLILGVAACSQGSSATKDAANANRRLQTDVYRPKNDVEFHNYNERLKIADDPSTILWCTAYLANPNVKPLTYPIVGKLTSSGKRPYASVDTNGDERAGPDHMLGTSTEYRYGFTPGGAYVDFTDIPTVCTTEPTVYQATQTTIILGTDPGLLAATNAAEAALKAGQAKNGTIDPAASAKAAEILAGHG